MQSSINSGAVNAVFAASELSSLRRLASLSLAQTCARARNVDISKLSRAEHGIARLTSAQELAVVQVLRAEIIVRSHMLATVVDSWSRMRPLKKERNTAVSANRAFFFGGL